MQRLFYLWLVAACLQTACIETIPTPQVIEGDDERSPKQTPRQPGVDSQQKPLTPAPEQLLAPPVNLPAPRQIRNVNVAYDFHGTLSRTSPTAAVLRMMVQSGALRNSTSVRIQGQLVSLRDSRVTVPINLVAPSSAGLIDTPVTGLQPETVYRLQGLTVSDAQNASLSEKVKSSYFLMTGGATPLAESRRRTVMRALAEAYEWENNSYDTSKRYAASSGWCDRFYVWAASQSFSLDNDDYAPSWFKRNGALQSSVDIAALSGKESISGDMVRYDYLFEGNHTFMIVSYDVGTNQVWTVEGNYNDRVQRSQRTLQSFWKLGHLTPDLVQEKNNQL